MDFKKDSYILGALIGLILPVLAYLFLFLISLALTSIFGIETSAYNEKLQLLSIVFNLFPMRYYFVKWKYERTAKAILLLTFILVIIYFLIY